MAVEDQAQKRATAEAYNFDEDSRWSDYWNNVLIPPQMSSRPEVRRHFQLKFYQRFIDPELEVEPISSLKGSSKDTPSVPKGPNISVNQRSTSNTASSARGTAGNVPPRPAPRAVPPQGLRDGNFCLIPFFTTIYF
jgi:RNA polymerase primary sigma factor